MEQPSQTDFQQVKTVITQSLQQLIDYLHEIEQNETNFYKTFFHALELPIPFEQILNAEISPLHSDILQAMVLDFMFNDCNIDFEILQKRFQYKIQGLSAEQRKHNQKIYDNIIKIIQISREQLKIYQNANKDESYQAAQKIITLLELMHNSSKNDGIHYNSFLSTFDFSAINRSLFGAEARQQLLTRYEFVRKENIILKSQLSNIGSLQHFQELVRAEEKTAHILQVINGMAIRYAGIQQNIQSYINTINQLINKIDEMFQNNTFISDFIKYANKDVIQQLNAPQDIFQSQIIEQNNNQSNNDDKQLTQSDLTYKSQNFQQTNNQITGIQVAQLLNKQIQQIQTLQVLLDNQSVQNTTQISQLEQSMNDIKEQKNQAHILENELLEVKNAFQLYKLENDEKLKSLTLENQQNNDIIQELKSQVQQQVIEMAQNEQEYQNKIQSLKITKKQQQLEIQQITINNNELQNTIEQLQDQKLTIDQQLVKTQEQLTELEINQNSLKAENEEKQQTITDLIQVQQETTRKYEQQIDDLKAQHLDEKSTYDEMLVYVQQSYDKEVETNETLRQTIEQQKEIIIETQQQIQQQVQQIDKTNLNNILLKNNIENSIKIAKSDINGSLQYLRDLCSQLQSSTNIQFISDYLIQLFTQQNHEIVASKQQSSQNLEELQTLKHDNQILNHTIKLHEQNIAELKITNADLLSQIALHLEKINSLQSDLLSNQQSNQMEVQQLNNKIKDLELNNQQLSLQNTQLTQKYADIQTQMQNDILNKEKYESQLEKLRQDNTKWQLDYTNATNRLSITIKDYKQQLAIEQSKYAQLSTENKNIQFELSECKEKLTKQHNSDAEVWKREQQIQKLNTDINSLEQVIQKKDIQIQQLSREIDDGQNKQQQLQKFIDDIQSQPGQGHEMSNEGVHALEKQQLEEENQRAQDLLNAYKSKVSELTRQNTESMSKRSRLEAELQSEAATNHRLQSKIEIYEQRIAQLEGQLKASEDKLSEATIKVKHLSQSLQASQMPKGESLGDFVDGVTLLLDKSWILQPPGKQ